MEGGGEDVCKILRISLFQSSLKAHQIDNPNNWFSSLNLNYKAAGSIGRHYWSFSLRRMKGEHVFKGRNEASQSNIVVLCFYFLWLLSFFFFSLYILEFCEPPINSTLRLPSFIFIASKPVFATSDIFSPSIHRHFITET